MSNFHDLEQERTVLSFALASVDNMGLVIDEVYADLLMILDILESGKQASTTTRTSGEHWIEMVFNPC